MEHHGNIDRAGARYSAERAEAIVACQLDDITLLYHRPSGQTHMVISPVPEVLDALREAGDATVEDVHAVLSRQFELGDGGDAVAAVRAHLETLTALGLVRRG